uniref:Uncharacterized protein n=1 Tax=Anguilla anguilla TaxID=7936 RepID=A0A0E9V2X3_ANGAN
MRNQPHTYIQLILSVTPEVTWI